MGVCLPGGSPLCSRFVPLVRKHRDEARAAIDEPHHVTIFCAIVIAVEVCMGRESKTGYMSVTAPLPYYSRGGSRCVMERKVRHELHGEEVSYELHGDV